MPEKWKDRPYHTHNRLIGSVTVTPDERRQTARVMAEKLLTAKAPVHVIMPRHGIEEWDKPGQPANDIEGLSAFNDEMSRVMKAPILYSEIDAHINDQAFVDKALEIFDGWVEDGTIKPY